MATFKVGQRVKVISTILGDRHLIGSEGRIAPDWDDPPRPGWHNVTLGIPNSWGFDSWHHPGWQFPPDCLVPLTNPGDEVWAADQVKKWTKPEPVVPVPQQEKERT